MGEEGKCLREFIFPSPNYNLSKIRRSVLSFNLNFFLMLPNFRSLLINIKYNNWWKFTIYNFYWLNSSVKVRNLGLVPYTLIFDWYESLILNICLNQMLYIQLSTVTDRNFIALYTHRLWKIMTFDCPQPNDFWRNTFPIKSQYLLTH